MTPKHNPAHSPPEPALHPEPAPRWPEPEHPVARRPCPEHPHLTVSPEEIAAGKLCRCEACLRDGPHEPDCPVHDEPRGRCKCRRADQSKGAG